MPKVKISNNDETNDINPMVSFLNNLLINNIPIETICGGRAICGKCVVKILRGKEYLSSLKEIESMRLKSLNLDVPEGKAVYRLACQTHTRRDITIEIINFKG